jgi:hypothetical protein
MDIGRPIAETELKLQDAGAQMRLALKHADDDELFRSCVNAFIAMARSVTMLMEKESAPFPELHAWYKQTIADVGSSPLFRFFHERRTHTVHRGVVRATRKGCEVISAWRVYDPAAEPGQREALEIDTSPAGEFQPRDIIHIRKGVAFAWYFDEPSSGWFMPSTNVFALCGPYFRALRELVDCWVWRWARLLPPDSFSTCMSPGQTASRPAATVLTERAHGSPKQPPSVPGETTPREDRERRERRIHWRVRFRDGSAQRRE